MKEKFKRIFPNFYTLLCRAKDSIVSNPSEQWGKYFDGRGCAIETDPFIASLQVPEHIDTVLDLGCGAGRNLIPFDGKYNLRGIDLVPFSRIKWLRPFRNLTYTQTRLQDFRPSDLSKTLVFSCGTLMYLLEREQWDFYQRCIAAGCRAFVFIEYPSGSGISNGDEEFKLPANLFKQFPGTREHVVYTSLA